MERYKQEGKDGSCVRLCRANGLGWESYFDRVRPYLSGMKARKGAVEWAEGETGYRWPS